MKIIIFLLLCYSNNAIAGAITDYRDNCKYFNIDGSKVKTYSDGMICQLLQNPKCFAIKSHQNYFIINCDPELTVFFNNIK